ncbi:MAG: efflux RND transporter periplasmic adaptor subunit [Rhizobiaceae bacterium]
MPKIRFHKIAALVVLAGFAAWIATGEFSAVGSAQDEAAPKTPEVVEEAKPPLRTVAVVTPPRVNHSRAIRLAGQTEANKRAVLTVRAAGIIDELNVSQGDRVDMGDLILKLDAEGKDAALESAEAVLAQRQAEFEAAERLAKSGSIPKLQLDTARAALAAAKAQVEAAKAEIERTQVRAPFAGVVDRVDVELGASAAQGAQVATIINLDPILGRGEVSERELVHLKIGDPADVRLVDGSTVKGDLRYISRDASSATRTFRAEVAIPNPEGRVPAGMTAEIVLRTEPVDSVILPRSIITLSRSGDLGIRAVDPENKVVFFPIDLVDDIENGLVLGGVPADARVIVAGQDIVSEGDIVNPVEADPEKVKELIGEVTGETQ